MKKQQISAIKGLRRDQHDKTILLNCVCGQLGYFCSESICLFKNKINNLFVFYNIVCSIPVLNYYIKTELLRHVVSLWAIKTVEKQGKQASNSERTVD